MEISYTSDEEKCTDCREPAIVLVVFDSGVELYLCRTCRDYCGLSISPQMLLNLGDEMATVRVVWYDGFRRVREECTLISRTDTTLTFKDAEGELFTIKATQLLKMT